MTNGKGEKQPFEQKTQIEECGSQFEDSTKNEIGEVANANKEEIFKRLEKRKENLEQQRSAHLAERTKNAAESRSVLDKLNEWGNSILDRIETSKSGNRSSESAKTGIESCVDYSAVISSLSEEIQKFDIFFNEKSPDLSPYDVRHTQVLSVDIKEKFVTLQDSLRPKKKFGFKSKYKKNVAAKSDETDKKNSTNDVSTPVKNPVPLNATSTLDTGTYTVTNPNSDNVVEVLANDIAGRDVIMNEQINNNHNQKLLVKILGNPGTVHATNLNNVTVLCGPVSTSIFVENCVDCDFVVACQQLRIHSTKHSNFYLHVTSKGIVEDCSSVWFAPYNLAYPNLTLHYTNSGLNQDVNNWNTIDDFNWLSNERPSPNWHILPETQRRENWLT